VKSYHWRDFERREANSSRLAGGLGCERELQDKGEGSGNRMNDGLWGVKEIMLLQLVVCINCEGYFNAIS
jgi:hypothetical protein